MTLDLESESVEVLFHFNLADPTDQPSCLGVRYKVSLIYLSPECQESASLPLCPMIEKEAIEDCSVEVLFQFKVVDPPTSLGIDLTVTYLFVARMVTKEPHYISPEVHVTEANTQPYCSFPR